MIELRRRYSGGVQTPSFSRLPEEYQEVEWLMNTGGAYIETNVVPPDGCCFELEAALKTAPLLQEPAYDYNVFGCDLNYNNIGFRLTFNNISAAPSLGITFHMGESMITKGGTNVFPTSDIFYKYKYENGTCTINDDVVLSDHPFIRFDYAIDIFAARRGNSHEGRQDGLKLKPLKLYTDTTDVAEFIPCYRTSDLVAGMYDIVNNVFYTNAGTGEFSCGQDVHYNIPFEYQEVEYLESTGTQRLAIPSVDTRLSDFYVKLKISVLEYNQEWTPFVVSNHSGAFWCGVKTTYFAIRQFNVKDYILIDREAENVVTNITIQKQETTLNLYINNILEKIITDVNFAYNAEYFTNIFNDGGNFYTKMKLYEFKSNFVDLIPCYRKEDNVAGMYDLVSGKFYTNEGTGEFIVGPDVI